MARKMTKADQPKRPRGRPRKHPVVDAAPARVPKPKRMKREPQLVARGVEPVCPRCGEVSAVVLRKVSSAGVRTYRCFSDACRDAGCIPGRGRGFVTIPATDGTRTAPAARIS